MRRRQSSGSQVVRRTINVAFATLLAAALISTTPAQSEVTKLPPKPPLKKSQDKHANGGAAGHHTDGLCDLYSSPGSFGVRCHRGTGTAETVGSILHGEPVPTCWLEDVSIQDLVDVYGYPKPEAGWVYKLRHCVGNIVLGNSPFYQPDMTHDAQIIKIRTDAGNCPQPYTAMMDDCLMPVEEPQSTVIAGLDAGNQGDIPDAILATKPMQKIRTHVEMTYYDAAFPKGSTNPRRTNNVIAGGKTMWAEMNESYIWPFGPGGERISCDVTLADGCKYTYKKSSHGQPNERYPFRMETDWVVYYRLPGGDPTELGRYQKYDDVDLPVLDVQSLIVH